MPELNAATIDQFAARVFRGEAQIEQIIESYSMDELLRAFEGSRRGMLRLLNGLNEAQINFTPDPNTYSLSEVVSHIVASQGNVYNAFIDLSLAERPHIDPVPRNPGGGAQKGLSAEVLQAEFQKATNDLVELARATYDPTIKTQIEYNQFGKLSYKGFMFFQLVHDLDHIKQAQTLRRSPLFPAK